jgi:small-conductance mechanosensitive channel
VDVPEQEQSGVAGQVAMVRARTRPWRSIIALVLAVIAAVASHWAANGGQGTLIFAGHSAASLLNIGGAVVFCLLSLIAILGLSGKVREVLTAQIGSAHAAVVRYAIVLAGGIIILLITLVLVGVDVRDLIVGGAFAAILLGIAAQQAFNNLFAGLVLLLARPFAVGDIVRMRGGAVSGQIDGIVTDIGITYVRLNTDDGPLSVPNAQVLASAVGPLRKSSAAAGPAVTAVGPAAASTSPAASAAPAAPAPVAPVAPASAALASSAAAAAAPPADGTAPPAGPVTRPDGAGQAGSGQPRC